MIKYFYALILLMLAISAHASVIVPIRDPFIKSVAITSPTIATKNKLINCWIPIYFAKASDIVVFLSKKSLDILSGQGSIHCDKRSNEILIQDDAAHIAIAKKLIAHLDKPGKQFLIAAKIINIDREYQKTLGFLFQTQSASLNSSTSLTMNQPDTNDNSGQFTLSIAKLAGNQLLNMQISALEDEGHATMISNPSLVTLNNQPAVIESGAEVPYQETTLTGSVNVRFKKAVLSLKVTPIQMPNHHILLRICLNQDKVSTLTVKGVPAIETQSIATQVIVKNNQTIVLGGILEAAHSNQTEGIPILDKIPLAGELFLHHQKIERRQELLIFITPSMMKTI